MTAVPIEAAEQARYVLRVIATEQPEALSNPGLMARLLADLLPESPKTARLIVAAAEDSVVDILREHVAQGMDAATASRLAAASFARGTHFQSEACAWVVGEFAIALGLTESVSGPPTIVPVLPDSRPATVTDGIEPAPMMPASQPAGEPDSRAAEPASTLPQRHVADESTAQDDAVEPQAGVTADGAEAEGTDADGADAAPSPPEANGRYRRAGRRWPLMSSILALFVLLVVAGLVVAYQQIYSQYYVGTSKGMVVIFRGLNQSVLGVSLSSVVQRTGIPVSGLPLSDQQTFGRTSFGSLARAQQSVVTLRQQYETCKAEFGRFAAWKAHPTKRERVPAINGHPRFKTVYKPRPGISATCMTAPDHPKP